MNIKIDSREVMQGDTFIAIDSGHNYIEDAISNGATTIVAEHCEYDIDTIIVGDTKKYLSKYLKENYYDKIKHIKLIGITGTNGKTTTSYLTYQALNKLGIKCAYIGTLGFIINEQLIKTNNTTPNNYELYNMLLECTKYNIEYVVMEVSSQGLSYNRVNELEFDYVAFTNLTQDHLDYHKTMDNYLKEKQKLFKLTRNGIAIINVDDPYSNNFILDNNKNITYGKLSNDYKLNIESISLEGSKFTLNDDLFETKLVGEYNIYNIAIVIIILKQLNLNTNIISELTSPNGRMDIINYKNNYIIIDYAHTPDAVEKIITEVKKIKHNKIITIIGCGGNRDSKKRSIMGNISTKCSDYVIFTSDNPRYENKRKILKDITCKLDKKNYKIIVNRRKAIKKGIQKLTKNDILLLLGKGHEDYQIIKDKKIHFSDKEEVLNIIRR